MVFAVSVLAPVVSVWWYKRGHSEIASSFLATVLTGIAGIAAWIAVNHISETINRARQGAGSTSYHLMFSGEEKLGAVLLWYGAIVVAAAVATIAAAIAVGRVSYRERFSRCANCDVDLVPDLPPREAQAKMFEPPAPQTSAARTKSIGRNPAIWLLAGVIIGIFATAAGERLVRYVRYMAPRNQDRLTIWAYSHVPAVLGHPFPPFARTLDTVWTIQSGNKSSGELRLIYESDGVIRIIHTKYRALNGQVVSPSDDELRELASSAPALVDSSSGQAR
jgi:hypothetical protein